MTIARVLTDERIAEIVSELYDDRVGFVKHVIRATPTEQQAEGLISQDKHDHTSVRSGHGTGKSGDSSFLILHYMSTRPGLPTDVNKIVCTAPTKHQLYDILWSELAKWHRGMNPLFRDMFQWTKERFFHKEYPETWFAAARTATKEKTEGLQGFHGSYVMKVIEEASGIPDEVFPVLDGAHGTKETKEWMVGNPTRSEGTFFRAFHQDKDFYDRLHWSCLNSPIVPKRFIERAERRFGKDSNYWRVRVIGEFPLSSGDTFIPIGLVEDAIKREILPQTDYPKVFGVDVARFGDDETAIAIRQGDRFFPVLVMNKYDTMAVAGYVAHLANEHKPRVIFVDVIGIGAGVYDRLRELNYPVVAVNVAELPASKPLEYNRLRDELWGNMRYWLEQRRGRLEDDEFGTLVGELSTPKYKFTSDGKIVIESKDDMRKRGVASPNRADAVNMTFAQPMSSYAPELELVGAGLYDENDEWRPFDRECGY